MLTKQVFAGIVLTVLAASSITAVAQPQDRDRDRVHRDQQVDRDRDLDRDRLRDRDRLDQPSRDRDRLQDRTHVPDFAKLKDGEIYGSEVMTRSERNEYRREMGRANTDEERDQVRARHQAEMQARAQERDVELKAASEGPIYGRSLLSQEERNQYREQLRVMESDEERQQFMAQHREEVQARAKARGVPFDDTDKTEESE